MSFWLLIPIAIGVLILRLPFRQPKTFGPRRCKRCRYIVIGIPGTTCPECGSDLRITGVTTRDGYLPPATAYLAVAWTLFSLFSILIPTAAIWTSLVNEYGPRAFDSTGDYYISTDWTIPHDHQFAIQWSARGIGFSPGKPNSVTVRLVQDRHALNQIPAAPLLQIASGSDPGVTLAQIKSWMRASGLSPYDRQFNHEATAIEIIAHDVLTHSAARQISRFQFPPELGVASTGSGSSQSSSPIPYLNLNLIPIALTLLIWIPGLHQIQKRRRRRK